MLGHGRGDYVLGDTIHHDGRAWVVCAWASDGTVFAVQIPHGETAMTMGRTWDSRDRRYPRMVLPPAKIDP